MEVKSIREVTAEGTNAGGDEIEALGSAKDHSNAAPREASAPEVIFSLIIKARAAMDVFISYNQEQVNEVVQAVAWAIIKQENAEELARLAVKDTGLGNYEDKVNKNQRKNLGTLRDLMNPSAKSVGVINVDEEKGIKIPLKPFAGEMGVAPGKTGAHSTIPPYATGGNIDTRHITAGSTLYLPIEVEGALFSIGVRELSRWRRE